MFSRVSISVGVGADTKLGTIDFSDDNTLTRQGAGSFAGLARVDTEAGNGIHGQVQLKFETQGTSDPTKWWLVTTKIKKTWKI